ncbi:MAG TPA: sensor domain-containing diguanylate cyclase [Burkholderiales bacterium]|jgi:diguanylate cyclase (GGDEF)-like protein|nr:sensor domain-containing diguanylate cyclase [Burkholderiales bacterium]
MTARRIPTIRSRLILLVLACIIPALLMVVALISYNYRQDRARLIQESMTTARAVMSAVDRDLAGMQSAMFSLSTSPHLDAPDLAAFYRQAKDVLKTQQAYNILLIDRNYQQRLNTVLPFGSTLPSGAAPWLRQVFRTGQPVITDIFMGPVAARPLLGVATPVRRGGTVIYVLGASVLPERLSELLTQQRLPADWIGTISDSTGTIVGRTHQMERFVGKKAVPDLIARMAQVPEDALESRTPEGIPVLLVFSRSAVSNWTMAIGIPSKNLTDRLAQTLWWLVAGTAILLLSSLALAWAIGSRIARSIHELAAPALALGSGEAVSVPSLQLKEADEVGKALTRASGMLMAAQHRANHDAMTGLANRAMFEEMLVQQLAICDRTGTRLALIYIDLDGFKAINDVHGHAIGDEVLRTVATRIANAIRKSDLAVRLGGDEFAVVLSHAGLDAAQALAEKLIEILSMRYSIETLTLEISASIGIAAYPESATAGEALLQRADEAMYKAKAAGKRRYAIAEASTSPAPM